MDESVIEIRTDSVRLFSITTLLALGIYAGCTEAYTTSNEVHHAHLEGAFFTLSVPPSSDTYRDYVEFGHCSQQGWHFFKSSSVSTLAPRNIKSSAVRTHPLFDISPGAIPPVSGARFSAQSPRAGGFSAASASTPGFRARSGAARSFDASVGPGRSFSAMLSTGHGGRCSLRGFCEFARVLCESFANVVDDDACDARTLQQCFAEADLTIGELSPSVQPLICAYAEYFDCVLAALRANTHHDQLNVVCNAQAQRIEQFMGTPLTMYE